METPHDFADRAGLPRDRVQMRHGVPIMFLPDVLDFDIGLVVRVEGRFNRSRTTTKGFELAAAGIPVVAVTDIPAYQDTAFLVDEDGFAEAIGELLDPDRRRLQAKLAREWAVWEAGVHRRLWPVELVAGRAG